MSYLVFKKKNCKRTYFLIICLIIILIRCIQPAFASGNVYKLYYDTDLILSGTGIALQLGSYYLGKKQDSLSASDTQSLSRSDANRFDRSATYNWSEKSDKWSTYIKTTLLASPSVLLAGEEPRNDVLIIGLMYIESIAIENGLTGIVKATINRKRPNVYNPDVSVKKKTSTNAVRSFYSGHASSSFNSAVFLSVVFLDYYPDSVLRYFVWSGSLLLASTTGYLRYCAGKHYPTDIITGAIMGSLIGYMVPAFHRYKDWKCSLLPFTNSETSGLLFVFKF